MPSWNIHAAHVQALTSAFDGPRLARELGVRSVNEFLFGNFTPDVYVGYLVGDVSHTLRYCDTHVTEPHAIPLPGARQFRDAYIEPYVASGGVDDLTLGVWAHLTADNVYNSLVRAYNDAHGIPAGTTTRIRKQKDFAHFGRQLAANLSVEATPALLSACERFGPYEVAPDDARKAVAAAKRLLSDSAEDAISGEAEELQVGPAACAADGYLLLTADFLAAAFNAADAAIRAGLTRYVAELRAAGFDPADPAPVREPKRLGLQEGPPPAILLAKDPEAASYEGQNRQDG